MERIPIIYSKNVDTGTIQQVRSVGNVLLSTNGGLDNLTDVSLTSPATNNFLRYNGTNWVNTARDYIVINMYGTSATGVHSSNTLKPIMAGISSYWQAPIPNPVTATNGNMASSISPLSSVFDTTTGFITINSAKRYLITATINQGGVNLANTLIELAIYDASGATPSAFSPNFINIGRADIDFSGITVTTNAVVSGTNKIAVMFRYTVGQTIAVNATDTCLTVSVLEI